MESKETNIKSQLENAKRQKTHFIASMSILGASLVAVIVIAVVTIIINGNKSLSPDSLELNGCTASELHSTIKDTVTATGNYTVTMVKNGNANLYNGLLTGDFFENIVVSVNGDDLYYKSENEKSYIYYDDYSSPSKVNVTKEITVIDGVAYIRIETNEVYSDGNHAAPVISETKHSAEDVSELINSLDIFNTILWENDTLFNDAPFEENSDGSYSVSSVAEDSAFKDIISEDIKIFFGEHANWLNIVENTNCHDADYTVVYNGEFRPVSITNGYTISGITSGSVLMESAITYGETKIELPENADKYIDAE